MKPNRPKPNETAVNLPTNSTNVHSDQHNVPQTSSNNNQKIGLIIAAVAVVLLGFYFIGGKNSSESSPSNQSNSNDQGLQDVQKQLKMIQDAVK